MHSRLPIALGALALALALPLSLHAKIPQDILTLGEQQYAACATCHGPDGKGLVAGDLKMAPSLIDSAFVKADPELLALIVLKGVKKESVDYVQQMLALESVLDNDNLAAVLTYVRHRFGGIDERVTPKQAADWRKHYKGIAASFSRQEYEQRLVNFNQQDSFLTDLKYSLYEGKWEELPDFSALTPKETKPVKNNRLNPDIAKQKGPFGLVFNGTLNVPETAKYKFSLASDDGARVIIDGEGLLDNDGIHPASKEKRATVELEKGQHSLEVRYFDHGGNKALLLTADAKPLGGTVALSNKVFGGSKKKETKAPDPILLEPLHENEAVLYRNFIDGSNPRGIAVGYPGNVSICWDADVMNLALLWRGDFMDASRHWTSRGQGNQPPASIDIIRPGGGLPLQVLASNDDPWIPQSVATLKSERDTPVTDKEITFNVRHPDYRFRGYRLDEDRFPTFAYEFQDLEVSDTFAPGADSIVRTLTFTGNAKPGTHFRLAENSALKLDDTAYQLGDSYTITVEGASPILRESANTKELLLDIDGDQTITVTYTWTQPSPPAQQRVNAR